MVYKVLLWIGSTGVVDSRLLGLYDLHIPAGKTVQL